jgi:hypothetical protein
MSDICIEFIWRAFHIPKVLAAKTCTTLIAVVTSHVVFASATSAPGGHLATRHRHKRTIRPLDNLQISHNKRLIEGDGAEGSQAILRLFHQLDPNLSNVHLDASHSVEIQT